MGPYESLEAVPAPYVRLLPRFPIEEQHQGQDVAVRNIDNAKTGGHNFCAQQSAQHQPADLDKLASMCRTVGEAFPGPIAGGTSDFKGAYRQITACLAQAGLFTVAMWHPTRNRVVFALAVAQLFGSGSAPLNFTRFPDFCVRAAGALLGIVCDHCVDDMIYVEALKTVASAYHSWRRLADDCGWDVPDAKSPPPSQYFTVLGAELDLTACPAEPMRL